MGKEREFGKGGGSRGLIKKGTPSWLAYSRQQLWGDDGVLEVAYADIQKPSFADGKRNESANARSRSQNQPGSEISAL